MSGKDEIIIVAFINPKPEAFIFNNWPNHITLVPWVRTGDAQSYISEVTKICQNYIQIPYTVGDIDYFGPCKNRVVNLVLAGKALPNLHSLLLKVAYNYDKSITDNHWGVKYVPHITHNEQPYVQKGEKGIITKISVVKKAVDTTNKKVVAVVPLK